MEKKIEATLARIWGEEEQSPIEGRVLENDTDPAIEAIRELHQALITEYGIEE